MNPSKPPGKPQIDDRQDLVSRRDASPAEQQVERDQVEQETSSMPGSSEIRGDIFSHPDSPTKKQNEPERRKNKPRQFK